VLGALGAFLTHASLPADAAAHGQAPAVLSVADQDDAGPLALRLGQGMALRQGLAWHFICPTRFQGEAQDPADALPGGGVAIGTAGGLWIMRRDGALAPHPDPGAAGSRIVALTSSEAGLFGLRSRTDLYDVVQIDADRVRVLFTDTRAWSDIGIADGYLVLVRYEGAALETLALSLEGQMLAQAQAPLPATPVAAFARPIADLPYIVVGFVGAAYELGRIEQGAWRILQEAGGNLAGPLQTADGKRFIAVEGALASFDAETVTPSSDPSSFVIGLRRLGSRSYACTTDGVRDVGSEGLGAQRFTFAELLPPQLDDLQGDQRMSCNLEWQHLLLDLRSNNIAVFDPTKVPEAAPTPTTAGAAGPSMAGSGGVGVPTGRAPSTSTGCSTSPFGAGESPLAWLVVLGLVFTTRRARLAMLAVQTLGRKRF
jgi:hypothetical protein